jgi:RHS repeat-associated protein
VGVRGRNCGSVLIAVAYAVVLLALPVAATATSPVNTAVPAISGTPRQGQVLTADTGTWTNSPASYAYQWQKCSQGGYSSTVLADNPAAFWRLNESSTAAAAADSTGHGNNGSYGGGVSVGTTSVPVTTETDTAATFNGSTGYVSAPNSSSLNPTAAITLEAWVKPSASVTQPIILKSFTSHNPPYYQYGLFQNGSGIRMDLALGGTQVSANSGGVSLTIGSWNYVVATWDGLTIRFYINGSAAGTASAGGTLSSYATPVDLATYENLRTSGSFYFWGGGLDEVAIYSTALTAARISAHYSTATTAAPGCTDISGETASSYTPVAADVGSTVKVRVTATNSDGSASAVSAETAAVTASAAPGNLVVPVISGVPQRTQPLTANTGTWSNSPSSYAYQWQSCSQGSYSSAVLADSPLAFWRLNELSAAAAAVDSSGHRNNGSYSGGVFLGTTAEADSGDKAATFNAVTGYASVPNSASLNPTSAITLEAWVKPSASYSEPIVLKSFTSHAAPYYQYGLFQEGSAIRMDLSVSGTRVTANSTASLTIGAWNYVVATWDGVTIRFYINGLTAGTASASGTLSSYATPVDLATYENLRTFGSPYFWGGALDEVAIYSTALSATRMMAHLAAATAAAGVCTDIAGATGSSYTPVAADLGSNVRVAVTATNSDGSSVSRSAQTAPIQELQSPQNTSLPTIAGQASVGSTLTASSGSWTNSPTSYAYQWRRCNNVGASCQDIAGATSSTYVFQSADVGLRVRVVVTATNADGPGTATSMPTSYDGYRAAVIADGPAAFWHLDETGGTSAADSSGNGNNAAYAGAHTHSTNVAPIGLDNDRSFSVAGASFSSANGSIPATALNVGSGSFNTVELWMYWDGTGTGQSVFDFSSTKAAYALWIDPTTIGFTAGGSELYGAPNIGLENSWHLIDAEFENGSLNLSKLWIDGVAQTLTLTGTNQTAAIATTGGNVATKISGWAEDSNRTFSGQLDEVSVFKGGLTSSQISTHWNAIDGAPSNLARPTVSGNDYADGKALTATHGSWSGTPTSYGYQWQRCRGSSCSNISGATATTYTLQDADVGSTITVITTASNAAGSGNASSAPTIPIFPLGSPHIAAMNQAVSVVSPYGYWKFDEKSGTTVADSSGNGHPLTASTGAWTAPSLWGRAGAASDSTSLQLRSSPNSATAGDRAYLSAGTASTFTDNFSVEAWVKLEGSISIQEIFGFGVPESAPGNGWGVVVTNQYGVEGRLQLYVNANPVATGPLVPIGEWIDIALTRVNGTWKVFLGGNLVIQHTGANPTPPDTFNFWFGSSAGANHDFGLLGNIASSAFYDHPLPDSTIKDHATTLLVPKVPPAQSLGSVGNGDLGVNPVSPHSPSVNTATGSFFQTVTDLRAPGPGVPFSFRRTYNSGSTNTGRLGQGWSDNFDWTWTKNSDNSVVVASGSGQQLHFTLLADGSYAADGGGRATLTATAGGGYTLVTNDQIHYAFNSSGQLTSERDGNNAGLLIGYASGNLTTITDSAGRVYDVTMDSGHITRVALRNNGGSVGFSYIGNLLNSVTDLRGGVTTYGYDSTSGRLTTITDPLSTIILTNTYDSATGRVTDQMDAIGGHTTFAWDPTTEIATVTSPDGKLWKDLYNDGVFVKWIDGTTNETFSLRDSNLGVTSVTAPSGDKTTMTRDANGNVLTETAPESLGSVQKTFTYDARNNPLTVTDPKGNVTSYTYDSLGNLTSITLNSTPLASYTYNSSGQPLTATDANDHTTTYAYDSTGNVTSVTDPLGNETTYTYDPTGHILTAVAPLGNVSGANQSDYTTTFTYDAAGNVLTATDPLGHSTTITYDAAGRVLTSTDANSHTTTFAYDGKGHLSSTTGADPDGSGPLLAPVSSYTYDGSGNQLTETDPNNHTTTYVYDASNRLLSRTTADGAKTTFGYDANGNLVNVTEPRGNVAGANAADYTTNYTYDAAGRQLTSTDPLGHVTTYVYDSVGNRSAVTDANNHTTTYTYDAVGRALSVTAPDAGVTSYVYDDNGNVLSRTDANNHTTNYLYDSANELIQVTSEDPDGPGPAPAPVITNAYDANGNLTATTDPNGNASSEMADGVTTRTYDRANRLTAVSYSDTTPAVTYSYDGAGNRVEATDGAGQVSYTYDNLDRLKTVARGADTFSYAYDAAGNVTTRSFPGGLTTQYGYDPVERMTSATTGGNVTSYAYDTAGNLATVTLPDTNGYIETRTVDRAGRLIDVKNASGANTLSEFAVTLDPVGNPTEVTRTGTIPSTTTYAYDASDRLTSVCYQASCPNSSDPSISWTYDKVGNRLSELRPSGTTNYIYNAADELIQSGATAYSYDINGNQLTAGVNTYTYDLANRMSSMSDGTTTTAYTYDGDGNRVEASTVDTTSSYLWDMNAWDGVPQLAVERDGSGGALRSYAYARGRTAMTSGGATFYYHYDPNGSVANLSSATGAVQWTYSYDPFGTTRTATKNDPAAPDNPMQFDGEYNDPNGLYNLRARQYDPNVGRMLAIDPLNEAPAGSVISPYIYVSDRPTVFSDPTGKLRCGNCPDDVGDPTEVVSTTPAPPTPASTPVTPSNPPPVDASPPPVGSESPADVPESHNDYAITGAEMGDWYVAVGAAVFYGGLATICLKNPACSGWGQESWNNAWLSDHRFVQNKAKLPWRPGAKEGDDEIFYEPPKNQPGPYFDRDKNGWRDRRGRIWQWDPSGHTDEHWDVQLPTGGYIRVGPDGKVRP